MRKKTAYLLFFLMAIIIFLYIGLLGSIYHQDEWYSLGLIYAFGKKYILLNTGNSWSLILGRGRVLTNLLTYIFMKISPMNTSPFVVFAQIVHLINTFLVYLIAKKIIKSEIPAAVAASFFALNSVAKEALIWPAASVNTLPATTLILLSLLLFFEFLFHSYRKHLIGSLILLYLSLFFKEIGVFLFVLYPVLYLSYTGKSVRNTIRKFWLIAFFGVIVSAFWIWYLRSLSPGSDLFLTGGSGGFFKTLAVRAIIYPLTSFSLTFLPSGFMVWLAKKITLLVYPSIPGELYNLVAQTTTLNAIALSLTIIMLIAVYALARKMKRRKKVMFSAVIIFTLMSFLPYIVISKNYAYLESRYYYLGGVGVGILLGFVTQVFEKQKRLWLKIIMTIIMVIYFGVHIKVIWTEVNTQRQLSNERKNILTKIENIHPNLGKKTIFFVNGDRNYYISDGNNIPFQQGFGYTLMVFYYPKSKFLGSFLGDKFLWKLGSQGYDEINGYGFGYFWDKTEFLKTIKKYDISNDEIVSLKYDSENNLLQVGQGI